MSIFHEMAQKPGKEGKTYVWLVVFVVLYSKCQWFMVFVVDNKGLELQSFTHYSQTASSHIKDEGHRPVTI